MRASTFEESREKSQITNLSVELGVLEQNENKNLTDANELNSNKHKVTHDYYKGKLTHRAEFISTFGRPIEEFDSMKRAVAGLSKASLVNYYNNLADYFLYLKENPDQVIVNRRKDLNSDDAEQEERYERQTKAYLKTLIEMGYAGRGIKGIKGRIGGFFKNNSKRYVLDISRLIIPKARKHKKYSPENPTVKRLYSFADSARDHLILLLMYQNGLPPIDVSELCVGDLPTEHWSYYEKSRSKTGEVWRGIVTPEISRELKILVEQLEQDEHFKSYCQNDTKKRKPLFWSREHHPMDNIAVSQMVKALITKSGLGEIEGFKPISLRDGFEDGLVDANINRKIKEAFMGHTSDIEHVYGGHNRMVTKLIEAMKSAYPFLALTDFKEELATNKNEFEELKTRLEQGEVELGRVVQEKNRDIADLKNEIQRIKLLKDHFEALLARVEKIEALLKSNSS